MPRAAQPVALKPVPPPRRRRTWTVLRLALIALVWATLAAAGALLWLSRDLPRPETALDAARRPGLTLQDRTGLPFATFGDVVGEPLRLADMPRCLPAAAVAVEDRRYWSHGAIDVVGIARAMWVNLRAMRFVQGGSTITQQVAKNLFLSNERTFRRKVQELMLTLWLEQTFTKEEILEIWLNRVYLGSGAWGMDAAAHMYFGTSARRLALWQCAVLAGLPRAPPASTPAPTRPPPPPAPTRCSTPWSTPPPSPGRGRRRHEADRLPPAPPRRRLVRRLGRRRIRRRHPRQRRRRRSARRSTRACNRSPSPG